MAATRPPAPSTPPPLLTKHGPRSWHAPRPAELVKLLDARADLHRWAPSASARDVRRGELARLYHKDPAAGATRVAPSGVVVSRDGWVRVNGEEPGRCAAILDHLADRYGHQVEPAAEQLTLFAVEGVR